MRKKTMRWSIKENKRKISTTNFTNHKDDIEMSGEKASMIIGYGANQNNIVSFTRKIVFPMFRIQPDVTTSSYILSFDKKVIDLGDETFQKAEIDYANEVAARLGVPLKVSRGSNDVENTIDFIRGRM